MQDFRYDLSDAHVSCLPLVVFNTFTASKFQDKIRMLNGIDVQGLLSYW